MFCLCKSYTTREQLQSSDQDYLAKAPGQARILHAGFYLPIIRGKEDWPSFSTCVISFCQTTRLFLDAATVVDRVLQANRNEPSLEALKTQGAGNEPDSRLTLHDGILLYQGRVIVPDVNCLRTHLIREVHGQISTAHPNIPLTTLNSRISKFRL
jgi:hypothetical protein